MLVIMRLSRLTDNFMRLECPCVCLSSVTFVHFASTVTILDVVEQSHFWTPMAPMAPIEVPDPRREAEASFTGLGDLRTPKDL